MGYVRETDAVRLKVTTQGGEDGEKGRERESGRNLSRGPPDGNSVQEHKEETSENTLHWKNRIISRFKNGLFKKTYQF